MYEYLLLISLLISSFAFLLSPSITRPLNLRPRPDDAFPTPTSHMQADTEVIFLELISDQPLAKHDKNAHVQVLARSFIRGFPVRYTSQDASSCSGHCRVSA
ncbi:CAAX farnesyltransferase (FTase) subunit beta [Pleurotus ostreatus]|nr:CAAX farnesyltransferase (FTase) subunit beta [Pleurotus ostreatus]